MKLGVLNKEDIELVQVSVNTNPMAKFIRRVDREVRRKEQGTHIQESSFMK